MTDILSVGSTGLVTARLGDGMLLSDSSLPCWVAPKSCERSHGVRQQPVPMWAFAEAHQCLPRSVPKWITRLTRRA